MSRNKKLFSWHVFPSTGLVGGGSGWYLVVLCQFGAVLVGTWWCCVSLGRYWLVLGGTGSVWGGTDWCLVVLGQYNLVLLGIKWYWVSIY